MNAEETSGGKAANGTLQAGAVASFLAQPSEEFLEALREYDVAMDEAQEARAEINARVKAVEEKLVVTYGVNKLALRAARAYSKINEKRQERWDLTYQVTRRAIGAPVQMELFGAQVNETGKRANAKARVRLQ